MPVFLQVLPLLSGVPVRDRPDPGEVAVDPRLQPDEPRDQRLALGDARRQRPRSGQGRRSASASSSILFVGGLGVLPLLRAALRGHDLMATAIAVEGLSKRYRIGQFRAAYGTLRDSISHGVKRARLRAPRRAASRDLGARRRLVRGRRRARSSASSARTAPASRRCSRSSRGSRRPPRGAPRSAAGSAACSRSARASIPS